MGRVGAGQAQRPLEADPGPQGAVVEFEGPVPVADRVGEAVHLHESHGAALMAVAEELAARGELRLPGQDSGERLDRLIIPGEGVRGPGTPLDQMAEVAE